MFDLIEAVPDSAQPYISLLWFCFLRHRCTLCLSSLRRNLFAKFRQNFISISARNSNFPANIVMFRLNFQYSISQNWWRFLTEFSRLERCSVLDSRQRSLVVDFNFCSTLVLLSAPSSLLMRSGACWIGFRFFMQLLPFSFVFVWGFLSGFFQAFPTRRFQRCKGMLIL